MGACKIIAGLDSCHSFHLNTTRWQKISRKNNRLLLMNQQKKSKGGKPTTLSCNNASLNRLYTTC